MAIIIRDPVTRLYFYPNGTWQSDSKNAKEFEEIDKAIRFCSAQGLDTYQLLRKEKGDEFIVLQRSPASQDPRAPIFRRSPDRE